ASDQIASDADAKDEEAERLTKAGSRPLAVQLRREAEELRLQADARHEKAEELLAEANRLREEAAGLVGGPGRDKTYDSWEIACAELCGGRHYAMRGRLFVHPSKEDYEAWLKVARAKQRSKSAGGEGTLTASR